MLMSGVFVPKKLKARLQERVAIAMMQRTGDGTGHSTDAQGGGRSCFPGADVTQPGAVGRPGGGGGGGGGTRCVRIRTWRLNSACNACAANVSLETPIHHALPIWHAARVSPAGLILQTMLLLLLTIGKILLACF